MVDGLDATAWYVHCSACHLLHLIHDLGKEGSDVIEGHANAVPSHAEKGMYLIPPGRWDEAGVGLQLSGLFEFYSMG
ncbi:MAG: hypothetical protein AAB697_03525 [Patescibacteria group bacterium]